MSRDDETSKCLQANKGGKYQRNVKLSPCSTDKNNIWNMDLKGKIISKRYPNYCLAPSLDRDEDYMKLKLSYCWTDSEKSWRFTSDGQIQYGGSSYSIKLEEGSFGENLYLAPSDRALAPVESPLKKVNLMKTNLKDLGKDISDSISSFSR